MKKSLLLFALATSAVSLFGAQAWFNVNNKSVSELEADINAAKAKGDTTFLQITSSATMTVDKSVDVDTVIFGSGTSNVSPAYVQINAGQTFTVGSLGENYGRPASQITFQGDGTFAVKGSKITFAESGPNLSTTGGDAQYYYFKQAGLFDLSSKTITVKNNNYVEIDNAQIVKNTGTALTMSGTSSLVVKNGYTDQLYFKNINLSDTAYFSMYSATAMIQGTNVFNDGTCFDFLRKDGNAVLPSLSVGGNLTLNKVDVSQMAYQIFLEDNATFTSNANEASVLARHIILKKANLILNTKNAFYGEPNNAPKLSIARAGAKIILGADNDFGAMNIYKSGTNAAGTLFFTLGGNNATFTAIDIQHDDAMMYITDFMEGLLYVSSDLVKNEDDSLLNIFSVTLDASGNILTQEKLYQNASGYITAIAVPEPAEWALIFGAIAFGFVAYRRRK